MLSLRITPGDYTFFKSLTSRIGMFFSSLGLFAGPLYPNPGGAFHRFTLQKPYIRVILFLEASLTAPAGRRRAETAFQAVHGKRIKKNLGSACAAGSIVDAAGGNDGPNEPQPTAIPGFLPDDACTFLTGE